jgi:hypothetical protein
MMEPSPGPAITLSSQRISASVPACRYSVYEASKRSSIPLDQPAASGTRTRAGLAHSAPCPRTWSRATPDCARTWHVRCREDHPQRFEVLVEVLDPSCPLHGDERRAVPDHPRRVVDGLKRAGVDLRPALVPRVGSCAAISPNSQR